MALLSNSLYLDSEYKADCEFKINYLSVKDIETDSNLQDENDVPKDNDVFTETITKLNTRIIKAESDERPYFSDGSILYPTKQISDNYYKIMLEID